MKINRDSFNKRLNGVQLKITEEGIDGLLITSPSSVYYLTGFNCHPHERFLGLFLTRSSEPILVVPSLELDRAKEEANVPFIYGYSDSEGVFSTLQNLFSERKEGMTWGIEKSVLSFERTEWLNEIFPAVKYVRADEWISNQRVIKDEYELLILREAAVLADDAVTVAINEIGVGKKEMEIVAKIEYEMKKRGVKEMSFSTTVLTGKHSAQPHGSPDDREIQAGDIVLIDLGVVHKGYCSDITRTVFVGNVSDEQRALYEAVLAGQLAALEVIKPGVKIKEVDYAARSTITSHGYGEFFTHRLGHGLGLEVHEYPSLHGANEDVLEEGMCFTVEPGAYVPHLGGVRIEDDVVVTREGVEVLTSFTKELIVI